MNRKKKLLFNTVCSLIYQVVSLVCGFILPRLILSAYGSNVNGLVSSITHMLGFFTLCECGMGAVVQSSLYKPFAEHDEKEVSMIIRSARKFFNIVAGILIAYIIALIFLYPVVIGDAFSPTFTIFLLLAMSISYFAQYYFGITYKLLLQADQLAYIQYIVNSIVLILNVITSVIFIKIGCSIQIVKLASSVLFLIQPLSMALYVRKHYHIDRHIVYTEEPIKQKWNGLAQHIANVVLSNTDTTVLTVFSTLANVSIYAVYHLVVNGMTQLLNSVSIGIKAFLGNVYYIDDEKRLTKTFSMLEWFMHTVTTLFFGVTLVLIIPFVKVYTVGINDADYIVPSFAVVITLAQTVYCLRLPYSMMIQAAGHYKQTQMSALIEAGLNIVISIIVVFHYGLVGVAVGTFVAMLYRTVYFAVYLSRNILYRHIKYFVKNILVDVISFCVMYSSTRWVQLTEVSFGGWIWMAVIVFLLCLVECIIINVFLYYKNVMQLKDYIVKGKKLR